MSGWDYLFQGALWIGAIVGDDTLVSCGHDGWFHEMEFFPGKAPGDSLVEKSIAPGRPGYIEGDTTAISEQDLIGVYTDTMTTADYSDVSPNHTRPIGIEVTQSSYAFSYSYAEDFIIFDYKISNIGKKSLKNVYMGLYLDGDCGPTPVDFTSSSLRAQDDITGFRKYDNSGKDISVAWIADYEATGGDEVLAPSVMGVRVVRTPAKELHINYNWWLSDSQADRDWGPGPRLPSGTTGTPDGDVSKYLVMSNWKQIPGSTNIDQYGNDVSQLEAMKQGQPVGAEDTRFLLSFGPFQIGSGEILPITLGYFCGENFYRAGDKSQMDFTDLDLNARWVQFVYDNPNVDTDGDGFYGEDVGCDGIPFTGDAGEGDGILQECEDLLGDPSRPGYGNGILDEGDGVPDFAGPPPPPSPKLKIQQLDKYVALKWTAEPEYFRDSFIPELSKQFDFQGYRLFVSRTGVGSEYTLLKDFDLDMVYMRNKNGELVLDPESKKPILVQDTLGINTGFREVLNRDADTLEVVDGDTTRYVYKFIYGPVVENWPLYFSITSYDNGYKPANLGSLESSVFTNATLLYPYVPLDKVQDKEVKVVPNPYKISTDYSTMGWEARPTQWSEFERRIDFTNLPGNCKITIFTIAGDVVAEIFNADGDTRESWDLLSVNNQSVVSGIYLFSIEPTNGGDTKVGKFVIIK
jgi:hypothetical protein